MDFSELKGWVQSACSEISANEYEADKAYDDPLLLGDLIGDHICGEPNRDDLLCEMIDEGGAFSEAAELITELL